jgi:tetratricopeptide (TPR) repeat protein
MMALVGCAQVVVRPELAQVQPPAAENPSAAPPALASSETELPKLELTRQLLYQFLLAEIASQRGEFAVASQAYLDLARKTRDPRIASRATEIAVYSRRSSEALEAAQLWLELDPKAERARQTVAALLVAGGRLEEARPHLQQLLADEGDNVGQGFLQLNNLLARHSDKAAVLKLTRDLARSYPDLAEAHFAVAQAAANAGEREAALAEVRRARALKPEWELALLLEAQLVRQDSPQDALALYRDYLGRYPKARDVRLAYARALTAERRYGDAREQFQAVLADHPRNPEVLAAVGLLAMQLKDYDAAAGYFGQALELNYRDKDAIRFFLGQLEEERKRYDQAAAWYLSVGKGEHQLQARVRYATVLAKQGKVEEGRTYLRQVAQENPDQEVPLTLAEAQLLREAEAYQEAFVLLGKALERMPENPDLLYDQAMVAEKLDRLDVLERNLRALIRLKPDHAHAYNALGYTLADRNQRLDEARRLIEKALELAPDDPFILDSMGWVEYRMGRVQEGLNYLQRAYGLRPDPEIAAHLGEVLWVLGRQDEARKVWDSALSEHPDNKVLLDAVHKFVR